MAGVPARAVARWSGVSFAPLPVGVEEGTGTGAALRRSADRCRVVRRPATIRSGWATVAASPISQVSRPAENGSPPVGDRVSRTTTRPAVMATSGGCGLGGLAEQHQRCRVGHCGEQDQHDRQHRRPLDVVRRVRPGWISIGGEHRVVSAADAGGAPAAGRLGDRRGERVGGGSGVCRAVQARLRRTVERGDVRWVRNAPIIWERSFSPSGSLIDGCRVRSWCCAGRRRVADWPR
jgi:hypothetical protein